MSIPTLSLPIRLIISSSGVPAKISDQLVIKGVRWKLTENIEYLVQLINYGSQRSAGTNIYKPMFTTTLTIAVCKAVSLRK
jgi:hypothetical protein